MSVQVAPMSRQAGPRQALRPEATVSEYVLENMRSELITALPGVHFDQVEHLVVLLVASIKSPVLLLSRSVQPVLTNIFFHDKISYGPQWPSLKFFLSSHSAGSSPSSGVSAPSKAQSSLLTPWPSTSYSTSRCTMAKRWMPDW
jgi:hypothetical protein